MDAGTKTVVTVFALMAELERDLISSRTKMALTAKKAAGVVLGKPRGTLQPSRLDQFDVKGMVDRGQSLVAIAKETGMSWCAIKSYVRSRGLLYGRNRNKEAVPDLRV